METNKKPKYKVHVWNNDVDNTETVFEAPAKPTLEQLYKLIGCTMVERVTDPVPHCRGEFSAVYWKI